MPALRACGGSSGAMTILSWIKMLSNKLRAAACNAKTAQLQIPFHDVLSLMYVSKERIQEVQDHDVPSDLPSGEVRFLQNLIHESRAEFHALAQILGSFQA